MLKPALMFRNHMILQRDKKVRIWGTAEPGESLVITVQGLEESCTADLGESSPPKSARLRPPSARL